MDHGEGGWLAQMNPITDHHEKTKTRVTTLVDERANELHDLLSCHHRPNGGAQIPVGDISQVQSRKRGLGGPSTHLQDLLDCTFPSKEERSTNLSDFVNFCLD